MSSSLFQLQLALFVFFLFINKYIYYYTYPKLVTEENHDPPTTYG